MVDQLSIGAEGYMTGILFRSLQILLRRFARARLFDLEGVSPFDPIEKVFSHHPLDSLPVLWADGIAGLQINLGGRESRRRTGEKTQRKR